MEQGRITRVRLKVLEEHNQLRLRLKEIDALAARVLTGEHGLTMELRRHVVDLEGKMEAHLAMEEAELLPIISTIDAWGPVRASRMREEHARQRQVFESAGDDATSPRVSPPELATMVRTLIADLLVDMKGEERDLLGEELMREDVIVIDQSDG